VASLQAPSPTGNGRSGATPAAQSPAAGTSAPSLRGRGLRIAFIGGRGVANTYSGIETYYEELGSRLAARGHSVLAYCRPYFTPEITTYRGIMVRRLPSVRSKHFDTALHTLLCTLDTARQELDIVQYHAIGPSLFSFAPRLWGQKTVASVRGLDWQRDKWGRVAALALKCGERASVRFPTATVVVSQTLRDYYTGKYGSGPVFIPNGVTPAIPRMPNRIRQFGLEKDQFLLFAGRLSPEKGCLELLDALRPLPRRIRLVFAGGSSYSNAYIEKLRRAAWDDVSFLGQVDRETMGELYSNCYAFVLPSKMEGLSVALLEAVSYGACTIVSDIPENLEVVGQSGLTFRTGNVESLRAALASALDDRALVRDARARSKELARNRFGWDAIAQRTEAFYYSLLKRAEPPSAVALPDPGR
jgi:glycosyltransferase involved in cell wall biosynthesis